MISGGGPILPSGWEERLFRDGTLDELARPPGRGSGAPRPRPGAGRAWAGQALPLFLLRAGGVPLPSSAHLLELCRRSDRPLRPVGRRLDDAGAALPLPSIRNLRAR